jgi:fibro-slime domain-containing protein
MFGRLRGLGLGALAVATVSAAAFEVHCGDRTGLPPPEPCKPVGSMQSCKNQCGMGEKVCQADGLWSDCVVPTASRPCVTRCGNGEQTCDNNMWQTTCTVPVATRACSNVCGSGTERCANDVWGACDAPLPGPPTLEAQILDFHPVGDFAPCSPPEPTCGTGGVDTQIVAFNLGPDGKPVYAGDPTTPSTHGKTDFDEWYNQVPGINELLPTLFKMPFMPPSDGSGTYTYVNEAFFPIDNELFKNQGLNHNYWFTAQIHTQILYKGGETYSFSSDDDCWVFINRRLAVDLGGIHATLSGSVSLDAVANSLGLMKGQMFPMDLFYADREPTGAVLTISIPTTDIWSCP